MSDQAERPDEARAALARSMFDISPLPTVAAAVSVATQHETCIYVERMARGWRWSLTHRGGAYPLLRVTAQFLRMDYRRLGVSVRTVDGVSVVGRRSKRPSSPRAWAFVEFEGPTPLDEVEQCIRQRFKELGDQGPVRSP